MAQGASPNERCLPDYIFDAEGREIRADKSDTTGGGLDTDEHRGGVRQKQ
jgi:hypothetical protein